MEAEVCSVNKAEFFLISHRAEESVDSLGSDRALAEPSGKYRRSAVAKGSRAATATVGVVLTDDACLQTADANGIES